MLDPVACAALTDAVQPLVAFAALRDLRALIDAQPVAPSLPVPADSLQKEGSCDASSAAGVTGSAAPTELGREPLVGSLARESTSPVPGGPGDPTTPGSVR
jgi:hypothetical protein